jgi:ribosomal subunit interface protein
MFEKESIIKSEPTKEIQMNGIQIEWGNIHRTEAIEADVMEKMGKIMTYAPTATGAVVHLSTINPTQSAGVNKQKVTIELRLPNHQDIHSEKEGEDLYKSMKEAQKAVLTQVKAKKEKHLI